MKKIILIIFVLILVAAGAFLYLSRNEEVNPQRCYSGAIESIASNLSFQVSGKIKSVFIDEGQQVKTHMVLAEIDASLYETKYQEALAMLNQAEKNRERMDILLDVYARSLPADVTRAQAGVRAAMALADTAQKDKTRFDGLKNEKAVAQKDWEAVNLKHETAASQLSQAQAVLEQALSNLKRMDLTRKEREVAETQYAAAKAMVGSARIQLDHTRLHAPFAGVVAVRNMEPGEVVSPGKEVLTLLDLSTVELKIFVGEEEIGRVNHGDKAEVKIDTFPDRIYEGNVSFISPQAEFTPKIIQTRKERVKLVYMVKLLIPNPDFSLKPGMPADACFPSMDEASSAMDHGKMKTALLPPGNEKETPLHWNAM